MKFFDRTIVAVTVSSLAIALALATTTTVRAQTTSELPTPAQLHDQLNAQIVSYAASVLNQATHYYATLTSSHDEHGMYGAFVFTASFTADQLAYLRSGLAEAGWQTTPIVFLGRDGWLIQPAAQWNQSRRGNEPADASSASGAKIPSVAAVFTAQEAAMRILVDSSLLKADFGCGSDEYNTIPVEGFFLEAIGNTEAQLALKGWNTKLISLGKNNEGLNRISLCISPK